MTTITVQEHKIRNEQAYVINENASVAAGGTLNLHVDNPSSNGTRAVITNIKVSSPDGKLEIHVPYGFTVDSTGTATSAENRTRGSSKTTSMNTYKNTTWSSASHEDISYVGTGSVGSGSAAGSTDEEVVATVLPGGDLIIEVENPSGSNARDAAITITYYETARE